MNTLRRAVVVSATGVTALSLSAFGAAAAGSAPHHLTGHASGAWRTSTASTTTTASATRMLRGHGHFTIGRARVRGTVAATPGLTSSTCAVTLRLISHRGSISLAGTAPGGTAGATGTPSCAGPLRFTFHATGATGSLKGATYQGHARLAFRSKSSTADHGRFMLRLRGSSLRATPSPTPTPTL